MHRLPRIVVSVLAAGGLVAAACSPAAPAAAPTSAPTTAAAAKPTEAATAAKPTTATAPAAASPAAAASPVAKPAASPVTAGAGGTGPIRLGALIPLTGPSAATGVDMRNGYELALKQINAAGGINGRPVEVIYEDDKNDPATAVASFNKLVNNDKVEVLMGGLASTISAALIEPAKAAKPNMAWTGAAATAVEKGFEGQDNFFHYHPWEYQNAASNLAFLKSTPQTKWAIAYEDGLFGQGAQQGFKDALPQQGQEVVAAEAFKSGSTDFTALINKLRAANPDGLILVPFAADVVPFLTQMREVGLRPKVIFAAPPSFPPDFEKSPVADGVVGAAVWTPEISTPASQKFLQDFRAANGGKDPVSYWAPLAYTNLVTVVDALKKSGTGNQAAWIAAMEQTNYASPLGPTLQFKPSQTIKHQGFTGLIQYQYQGGKGVIIFPESLATGKLK